MADIAEEVIQQLNNLQAADDARRHLVLRFVHTGGNQRSSVCAILDVEHRDGRKLCMLQKTDAKNKFQFEASDLDKAIALFCEIGRQFNTSFFDSSYLQICDERNGDVISNSYVNIEGHLRSL